MDRIINPYILKGVGVLRDVIIYTVTLGVREVINGSPIRRVLLGDHSYGVTVQMREGEDGKGPATLPNCISLSRFAEIISGCREAETRLRDTLSH